MRYLFKHVLLRDVAYDIQLRSRLRELHRRAAEAIETLYVDELAPYYADLAYHYGQAEMLEKERYYAFLAGKQAASEYANEAAVHFLSRALELTSETDRESWCRILSVRERVYDLQGYRDAQRKDLQMLLVLAKGENKAHMVLRQAHYAETVGNYTGAVSFAQRAVQLAQRYGNVQLEAAAYLRWGRGMWRQGQYKEAIPHFEQALKLARQSRLPTLDSPSDFGSPSDLEADSLRNIGNAYWAQGKLDKAMAYYQEALPHYRALHHKKGEGATLNNIAIVMMNQGEYVQARHYSEQARQLKESIGDHIGAGIAYATLGEIARQLGQYDEALAHHQRSLQLSRTAADSPGEGEAHVSLARLYHLKALAATASIDHWTLAWEHVQQGLTIARSLHDMNLEADAQLCLGHINLSAEKFLEAQAAYTRAWELRCDLSQSHRAMEARAGLASVALAQDNRESACVHIKAILPYMASHPTLDGVEEPCLVYWTCYRVLDATQDPRAFEILTIAHHHLQTKAANIEDATLRRSFLENVTVRRRLIEKYQRRNASKA